MTSPKPQPGLDAFHRERSRCIDAFAGFEEAVTRTIHMAGLASNGMPLGQKLMALGTAKASPRFGKAKIAELKALLPRAAKLNEMRNDIVHSRLQIAVISDQQRACFTNARDCLAESQTARLFTLEGMRAVRNESEALTGALLEL